MDRSKVSAAAGALGRDITFVGPGALADADVAGALVLADLGRPGVVDAIASISAAGHAARIIGFGSHVDRDLLDAARSAGATEVLARSVFFSTLATLLA